MKVYIILENCDHNTFTKVLKVFAQLEDAENYLNILKEDKVNCEFCTYSIVTKTVY